MTTEKREQGEKAGAGTVAGAEPETCREEIERLSRDLAFVQKKLQIVGNITRHDILNQMTAIMGYNELLLTMVEDGKLLGFLEIEHRAYYRTPPIFLSKDTGRAAVERDLLAAQRDGAALFVHDEDGSPSACFHVARCKGLEEGRLLRDTNSAQVLSAYARPRSRGRGVGRALLNACVGWARSQGFERLMVEHETANLLGSAFWGRHFNPYLLFSMRYVEA